MGISLMFASRYLRKREQLFLFFGLLFVPFSPGQCGLLQLLRVLVLGWASYLHFWLMETVEACLMGVWTRMPLTALAGARVEVHFLQLVLLFVSWIRSMTLKVVAQTTIFLLTLGDVHREN